MAPENATHDFDHRRVKLEADEKEFRAENESGNWASEEDKILRRKKSSRAHNVDVGSTAFLNCSIPGETLFFLHLSVCLFV